MKIIEKIFKQKFDKDNNSTVNAVVSKNLKSFLNKMSAKKIIIYAIVAILIVIIVIAGFIALAVWLIGSIIPYVGEIIPTIPQIKEIIPDFTIPQAEEVIPGLVDTDALIDSGIDAGLEELVQ